MQYVTKPVGHGHAFGLRAKTMLLAQYKYVLCEGIFNY
jgi:hypothetical protein